ncbi:TetR/AcrR family transcriptional regulator [Leucobacter komagatae]|uniref:TetR/AcrR family transcriptional regulator n=1 Tax=Leucobacter komagatae TaxID=55969 RepID=UPI0006967ECB|nr:TetR family transcriptional regulator [Leucobacter komagatae]
MAGADTGGSESHSAGRGRRPGPPRGRHLVLAAAHTQFGEHGYQGTTIRGIAAAAGVDPKLVHYYYGTKAELFTAVIAETFSTRGLPDILAEQVNDGHGSVGIRYVNTVLTALEHSDMGPAFIGLVRNIGTHEESRQIFLNFVSRELISKLAPRLDADRPETRVSVAGSQMLGFVIARYVLRVPHVAEMSIAEAANAIGPTMDRYIVGDIAWGGQNGAAPPP